MVHLTRRNEWMRDRAKSIHHVRIRTIKASAEKKRKWEGEKGWDENESNMARCFVISIYLDIYFFLCFFLFYTTRKRFFPFHCVSMSRVCEQTNEESKQKKKKKKKKKMKKKMERTRQKKKNELGNWIIIERMCIKTNKTARTHVDSRCDKIKRMTDRKRRGKRRCRINWDSSRLHIDRACFFYIFLS